MAWTPGLKYLWSWLSLAYGLCVFAAWKVVAVLKGAYCSRLTEKESLELLLAKDAFWNLSKDWAGLGHYFLRLANGFQFHYVANHPPQTDESNQDQRPLVLFIHGFPDSWALWRHPLTSSELRTSCTMIAMDLPGYGGSDSLPRYGATEVLEALTEFIVTIREQYGVDNFSFGHRPTGRRRVIIVGHDWGALLGFRLASEASQLADRFILINGPLMPLVKYNIMMAVQSATKMLKTFLRRPLLSGLTPMKAFCQLKRVLGQLRRSGYIFAFQLPLPLVSSFGIGGNYYFLKFVHRHAAGTLPGEFTVRDAQDSMASTLGPGRNEYGTKTYQASRSEGYSESVCKRQMGGNFGDITAYYRHRAATGTWHKSLETISSLHAIYPHEPRRESSVAGLFDPAPGVLHASATVLWGMTDRALDSHLMLEGIGDYLVRGSQVVVLPRTGHFVPMEVEGRTALEETLKWAVDEGTTKAAAGKGMDLGARVAAVYPNASVMIKK